MDIAMMLKEVQMPPRLFLKVMSRARLTADWTRVVCATRGAHLQVQRMRVRLNLQMLADQRPRRLDPNAQQQNLIPVHAVLLGSD
jgi:hypothetical protein